MLSHLSHGPTSSPVRWRDLLQNSIVLAVESEPIESDGIPEAETLCCSVYGRDRTGEVAIGLFMFSMAVSGTDWLEIPTIHKACFWGLCKGISPQNMAYMLHYLQFRILKFPLIPAWIWMTHVHWYHWSSVIVNIEANLWFFFTIKLWICMVKLEVSYILGKPQIHSLTFFTGWWLTYPSEKSWSSSMGRIIPIHIWNGK
jgi:hypothetical protein